MNATGSIKTASLALCLGVLLLPQAARAQGAPGPALDLLPAQITWAPTPIAGVRSALLAGHVQQPGLYILRVKLAAGARLLPHSHPDVRNTTVLSGEMHFGFGDTFDPDRMKVYPAGAIIAIPAGMPHYVWAKTGEVIVQDVGLGPTGTTPVAK